MPQTESDSPKSGDWVEIEGFLRVGRIVSIDAKRRIAQVDVAGVPWKVELERLKATATAREIGGRIEKENAAAPFSLPVVQGTDVIDLHGLRVEDAVEVLDKFVDTAIVSRFETIKIIHGHGAGKLREAVRKYLVAHRDVRDFQFGAPWEGGLAVTVVRLGRK